MKKFEFSAFSNRLTELGIKKIRRVGQTTEFDQIKEYVRGDDPRNINWKASAKSTDLMINHYEDERSQPVYCLVDKGRLMRSPFEGLTLLDYAVNSALVMSRILETLYNQKTYYKESNFELLATYVRRTLKSRSLLLLYTNFDNLSSFKRQLPYLRMLGKKHLLVVVFFENTELDELIQNEPKDSEGIYTQVIAEQIALEKQLIVKELKKNGIFAILTPPADLNVNTINKYLELKARGMV